VFARRVSVRRKHRATAVVIAVALHGIALVVGAGVECGFSTRDAAWGSPEGARYEARVVERPAATDDCAPAPRPLVDRDAVPAPSGGDAPVPALFADEADDLAPPCAAPSISVAGGPRAAATPSEWAMRPTLAKSAYFGRGAGGRRADGRGAGGVVAAQSDGPAEYATQKTIADEPAPRAAVRVAARLVAYAAPRYPEVARERDLEGVVRVEADVRADGTVADVRVVRSSGVAAFDDAAVSAVRSWTFAPATIDGVAVASTIDLPAIRFRLE